jgi:hypothetical protein
MVSDGSPTGCSVAALTALVDRLTRRMKMLCAQVPVRPLDDVSFPHYVLLEEDRIDESLKRFGAVMMKLVRQALRGGGRFGVTYPLRGTQAARNMPSCSGVRLSFCRRGGASVTISRRGWSSECSPRPGYRIAQSRH